MTTIPDRIDIPKTSLVQAARIVIVASWVAIGLGVLGTTTSMADEPGLAVAAAVSSGVFVAVISFLSPGRLTRPSLQLEIAIVTGVILTTASTTLTGRLSSPYVLVALIPTLLGAVAGGRRLGLTTSFLSGALLIGVTVAAGGVTALSEGLGTIALFPLLAMVVAQVRVLLLDVEARATSLEIASLEAEAELARLGQANDLLRRLTDVYASGGSNPVDVGRSAMDAIVDFQPGSFATATLFDSQGPVVIARAGSDSADLVRTQFPLGVRNNTSGVVSLGTPDHLSDSDRREIERLLRPVSVSFANAVLLQEIAAEAVREERLRLARELHDEVGPALAALGFSLDAVSMDLSEQTESHAIAEIRETLGQTIDDLRGIIADLRSDESSSLTSVLSRSLAERTGPAEVTIDLHERRPPRSIASRQIQAIVLEAVRNAQKHADANHIAITGQVDRNHADIEIVDDGAGFDPGNLPEGHYGVMGMRERADRIGGVVEIESTSSGSTVRLRWKER